MKNFKVIIVGGGASGLMCALRLGDFGVRNIAVFERNDRVGRKLSATGNGQGNISNVHMSAEHYNSSDLNKVQKIIGAFDSRSLQKYLTGLGGLFSADEEGRIYPTSRQASSVTDILRYELQRRAVDIYLGEKVLSVVKRQNGFSVQTDKQTVSADVVILANGGCAAPHFGTDGNGYALAKSFGHTITCLSPALVQLKTEQKYIKGLKGVRCDCRLSLQRDAVPLRSVCGDVIFTDYGISGNAVFKISSYCRRGDAAVIDFLPNIEKRELISVLNNKTENYADLPAEDLFRCIVNSAVGKCILRYCGVENRLRLGELKDRVNDLAEAIKSFRLKIEGCLGFDSAQVTKGGVCMCELDDGLMSKKADGLYIIGELDDVDGECGGYNLQWAFSSANAAAKSIAEWFLK